MNVQVNDVIHLDPAQSTWGPLLCIVSEVKSWGVQCYALVPEQRDKLPGCMYLRVEHGKYVYIGRVEWAVATREDSSDPESS
jgi:hypothetical protein